MEKLICKFFGHKWKYNFPSLPNKCICERCMIKQKLNLYNIHWEFVKEFKGETRTDSELIKNWFYGK